MYQESPILDLSRRHSSQSTENKKTEKVKQIDTAVVRRQSVAFTRSIKEAL
jgi:hypothetical protein